MNHFSENGAQSNFGDAKRERGKRERTVFLSVPFQFGLRRETLLLVSPMICGTFTGRYLLANEGKNPGI
jgi:hypothetical protein